jgi:predicted nucleic acid-binding protein
VTVVSNAGPLIGLAKLGRLAVLGQLYDRVLIPQEVYQEVVINGMRLGAPDADVVQFFIDQGQIQVRPIEVASDNPLFAYGIDAGEIEAIALAQREAAEWVLIDNAHARRAARAVGLTCKGTVGVLLQAFRHRYITFSDFELLMREIKRQPMLWISDRLCDAALEQARQEATEREEG